VNQDLYLNITEAVKIQAHGKSGGISMKTGNGVLTEYYSHPEALRYHKLKELLTKAK
jgi:hypothetical protein